MRLAANVIPAVTVVLLAIAGVLPWGHGHELRFCLPALAFIPMHFWQHERATLMPPAFVAAIGLGIDVLTSGPIGFWPLVFLAGLAATWLSGAVLDGGEGVARWAGFVFASAGMSLAGWTIASGYAMRPVAWLPMLVSVMVQSLAYPMVAALLRPLALVVAGPRVLTLERAR